MTESENKVKQVLQGIGFEVFHNGWPDFLAYDKGSGEYIFIEVKKQPNEKLNNNQKQIHNIFKKIGIPILLIRSETELFLLKDIAKKSCLLTGRLEAKKNMTNTVLLTTGQLGYYLGIGQEMVKWLRTQSDFPVPIREVKTVWHTMARYWQKTDIDLWIDNGNLEKTIRNYQLEFIRKTG